MERIAETIRPQRDSPTLYGLLRSMHFSPYELKVKSQTKFQLSRSIGLRSNSAELRGRSQRQRWIARLEVVHYIGELEAERGADPLRELELLGDGPIEVPSWQTSHRVIPATTGVNAQDTFPEFSD